MWGKDFDNIELTSQNFSNFQKPICLIFHKMSMKWATQKYKKQNAKARGSTFFAFGPRKLPMYTPKMKKKREIKTEN